MLLEDGDELLMEDGLTSSDTIILESDAGSGEDVILNEDGTELLLETSATDLSLMGKIKIEDDYLPPKV